MPYRELRERHYPVIDQSGTRGTDDFYEAEFVLLEDTEDTAGYVHLSVAVDDGRLNALAPVSTRFLVYADGHVDAPA
jgi:hypothetical protein